MRIRTILAAAAAPAALAAVLLGTTAANAATNPNANPGNGAVVITSQSQLDKLVAQGNGTINKNVVVPASVTQADNIWLGWTHVTGNVSVEGYLTMTGDTVDGNVTVSGPGSFLGLSNFASHFGRNLTVQNSSGTYQGGPGTMSFGNWTQYNAPSQVDGSFTFINNSGGLYSGYPMHVTGGFTYTGNTGPVLDRGGLNVDGQQNIS